MCGIAGIVAWNDRYRITRETLSRMTDAIAHRGPDGRDQWINHDQMITPDHPQAGMAFCRLAILDPDPRAMQPMSDRRRHLVFNGEIFNFQNLKLKLKTRKWKTSGDSEVLLAAVDAWGIEALNKLDGMFAFAVWDESERSLLLVRDRMGQKPLYSAAAPDGGAIAFASELSALRVLDWPDWSVDENAIGDYLETGYIPAPATAFRGTQKLPPASWMKCTYGKTETGVYFDPNTPDKPRTGIGSAVIDAVGRQLVSDVPIGCFLSGGIDSSVIASAMCAHTEHVLTFSIGFDDPRYDETPYAAEVAKHLGTEHRQFIVRPDAAADLPKLSQVFGEPFGDSSALPTHYLARETRQFVKVALSGDGGDELLGGYDRYRAMQLGTAARKIPASLRAAVGLLPGSHPKSAAARMKRFAKTLNLPDDQRYAAYMQLLDPEIGLPRRNRIADVFRSLSPGRDAVQTALAVDRITYLPDDVLTKLDRASMLHALEVRSPFMDPQLVKFCAGLTTMQLLLGGGKRLLREAFAADLPVAVFKREKMGFAMPIGDWLRTSLRPMLHDLLFAGDAFAARLNVAAIRRLIDEHEAKRVDHSQRLYALLMLELWWRGLRADSVAR